MARAEARPRAAAAGPEAASRRAGGRLGLGLTAASVVLVAGTAALGPSAAVPPVRPEVSGSGSGPVPGLPLHLAVGPHPWLVTGLLAGAYLLGAAGLVLGLRALAGGWSPPTRPLLAAGALAVALLAVLPPVGSADHLSYAAYGRIALAGDDPYVEAPARWRSGADPVTAAVEPPWELTPSVYGPVVTATQALASWLGGDSVAATVAWLSVGNALAFLGAGVLLLHLAGPDPPRRARAVLVWTLNPLLLALLVAGAHVDALVVALAVAGLAALRRSPWLAGALLGAAVGAKVSIVLLGVAAAWALRRRPGDLARLAGGGLAVALPAYAVAGPHAFDQLRDASRYVSLATPWNLVVEPADRLLGFGASRVTLGVAAAGLAVLLAAALALLLPPGRDREPAADAVAGFPGEDPVAAAAAAGSVLVGAWLLSAPYSLPWYDAALWAPLALLPASRLDWVAVARTATLALAYVPGRAGLPSPVGEPTLLWRAEVTPWFGLALVALVLTWGWRARGGRPVPRPRLRARPAPGR